MTILNELIYYQIDYHLGFSWWSFLGVGLVALGVLFIMLYDADWDCPGWAVFITMCFIITGMGITFIRKDKIPINRYEVIITDDNLTFEEFNNKYKLIEERGDILVIEEKNDEKS